MAFTWRIRVTGIDVFPKADITPADGVAALETLSLDSMGSCQEATITALPGAIDLEPRDLITVDYSFDDGATWTFSQYRGVIVSAPNPRSTRVGAYRAIGLKQRLYEVIQTEPIIDSADVASMAYLMAQSALAQDVLGVDLPFPDTFAALGFTLGDRATKLETIGDGLDALAAMVGSFTVPTGETYTYDGRTWTEGEVVPAVRWGVDGSGLIFFNRPTGDPLAFNEGDRRVEVEWADTSAEAVNDRATLVYASALAPGGVLRLPTEEDPTQDVSPLHIRTGTGDYQADRLEVLPNPLDFMEDAPDSQSGTGMTDQANAFDGDPLTFATFGTALRASIDSDDGLIARIRLLTNTSRIGGAATAPNVKVELNFYLGGGLVLVGRATYLIEPTDAAVERTLILPALFPASKVGGTNPVIQVQVLAATNVRCYALELFRPIAEDATRLGQIFARLPQEQVATVRYHGLIPVPSRANPAGRRIDAEINALDGATVTAPIERIELGITVEEGPTTRVYLGQPFDSGDEALRVVLERLARRAVAEGGARA